MKILRTCADPSCSILGMGMFCIAHDAKETRVFPRGRPFFRDEPAVVVVHASRPGGRTSGRIAAPAR